MDDQERIVNQTFQMTSMLRENGRDEPKKSEKFHFSGDVDFNIESLPTDADPEAQLVAQAFQNFLLPFFQRQGYWLVQIRADKGFQPVPWVVNAPYDQYQKEGDHLEVTLRVPTARILYLNAVQVLFLREDTEVRVNGDVNLEQNHPKEVEHLTLVFAPEKGREMWVQATLYRDHFAEPLRTLKPTPPPRDNLPSALWIPSDVVSRTVRRIAWGQLSLKKTDYGLPVYQAKTKESEVAIMPTITTGDGVEIALRLAQALQDEAIALDWCVALGLWLLDGGPGHDVTLNLNDMLAMEGHRKHAKGGYPTAAKQALKERLKTLRSFDVHVNATVYQGNQVKPVSLNAQLCMADFLDELDEKDLQRPPIPYLCWFRPGRWIEPFLGEETGDTKYLMAIMQNLFQFSNMPNDRWPFRLGLTLNVEWRLGQSRSGVPYKATVKRLLEEACLLGEEAKKSPQKVKDRFEEAMDRLLEAGCVRLPDMEHEGKRTYEGKPLAWVYSGMTEEELAAWEEHRPPRGWFGQWLSWKVLLLPPDPEARFRLDRVREERKRLLDKQRQSKRTRRKT